MHGSSSSPRPMIMVPAPRADGREVREVTGELASRVRQRGWQRSCQVGVRMERRRSGGTHSPTDRPAPRFWRNMDVSMFAAAEAVARDPSVSSHSRTCALRALIQYWQSAAPPAMVPRMWPVTGRTLSVVREPTSLPSEARESTAAMMPPSKTKESVVVPWAMSSVVPSGSSTLGTEGADGGPKLEGAERAPLRAPAPPRRRACSRSAMVRTICLLRFARTPCL